MFIKDKKKEEEIRLGMIEDLESFHGKELTKLRDMNYPQVFEVWITEYRKGEEFFNLVKETDEVLNKEAGTSTRPVLEL